MKKIYICLVVIIKLSSQQKIKEISHESNHWLLVKWILYLVSGKGGSSSLYFHGKILISELQLSLRDLWKTVLSTSLGVLFWLSPSSKIYIFSQKVLLVYLLVNSIICSVHSSVLEIISYNVIKYLYEQWA